MEAEQFIKQNGFIMWRDLIVFNQSPVVGKI